MTKAYSAKWIMAQDGNIYEDCTLLVDEGKVLEIIKTSNLNRQEIKHIKELGNSVITPGFINLHNHLQYTNIGKTKLKGFKENTKKIFTDIKKHYHLAGIPKNSFTYKLANLLSEYFCYTREDKIKSFKKGLELSLLNGTTCVCQLSKETKYFEVLNDVPIKTYLFFELFSDSPDSSKEEFRNIRKRIDKLLKQKSENTFVGVAPHSVTSVHKRLFKILNKYCKKNNILMTIRLAESKDEIDWVKYGFSDSDVLNAFCGNRKFEPYIQGVSPVEYLRGLDILNKQTIVTYGNYLTKTDFEILKENKVSFCYCPRVSKFLHGKVPDFAQINETFGKRYGFGTNNLAFNDDLSLLNEVKSVNNGILQADEVIAHLTIIPAKILRLDNITGSLEISKDADFNVFKLEDNESWQDVITKTRPLYVYVKGHKMVSKGEIVTGSI
ncbi:MAG: amidohydrolase family protein [Candidatus Gastranaerophilales bacterium]|nr:amidohydrolase family protein [Candidatus Gastranaerophilales bacterium]